ncbi:MAG: ECF transporter S component [Eggerthellaceae bacterium]|jgi:riboflavin transporter FmnP
MPKENDEVKKVESAQESPAKTSKSEQADGGLETDRTKVSAAPIRNTNKWATNDLVIMSLLCALGILLSFVEFPIFPAAPFLKYDASFMTAMVCGFAFGPASGVAVGMVIVVVHGLILGDFAGSLMNAIIVIGFVLPAALVYKRSHTLRAAVLGLVISGVLATILAILANMVVTPLYLGVPIDAVIAMILPILLPFNLMKAIINAILTIIVYRAIRKFISPQRQIVSR